MKEYYVALVMFLLWQVFCNIVLMREMKKEKKPWSEYTKECQETRAGQIMMTIYYWPTAIMVSL